jgi:hypothetical protein
LRAEDQYRAADKKDILKKKKKGMKLLSNGTRTATAYLEYASERQNEAGAGAHEEDGGDVEAKGKGGIGKEYERANACKLEERRETLGEGKDGKVDEGADGRVIVERDKRIHLETV